MKSQYSISKSYVVIVSAHNWSLLTEWMSVMACDQYGEEILYQKLRLVPTSRFDYSFVLQVSIIVMHMQPVSSFRLTWRVNFVHHVPVLMRSLKLARACRSSNGLLLNLTIKYSQVFEMIANSLLANSILFLLPAICQISH